MLEGAEPLGQCGYRVGLFLSYLKQPITLRREGQRDRVLLSDQFSGQFLGALGVLSFADIGVVFPIVFSEKGEHVDGSMVSGQSVGDLLLRVKLSLPTLARALHTALIAEVLFPTGDPGQFSGDGGFGVRGSAVAGLSLGRFHALLSLGYGYRPETYLLATPLGNHELRFGVGTSVDFLRKSLMVGLSLLGSIVPNEIEVDTSPTEAIVETRYRIAIGLEAVAAIGTGLVPGVGAPDLRVFAGVAFAPQSDRAAPPPDGPIEPPPRVPETPTSKEKKATVFGPHAESTPAPAPQPEAPVAPPPPPPTWICPAQTAGSATNELIIVYFPVGQAEIENEYNLQNKVKIEECARHVIRRIRKCKRVVVTVNGYADETPFHDRNGYELKRWLSDTLNKKLSSGRAKRLSRYLKKLLRAEKSSSSKITFAEVGKGKQVSPDHSEESLRSNRRVEVVISSCK